MYTLAQQTGLPKGAIGVWFNNRRKTEAENQEVLKQKAHQIQRKHHLNSRNHSSSPQGMKSSKSTGSLALSISNATSMPPKTSLAHARSTSSSSMPAIASVMDVSVECKHCGFSFDDSKSLNRHASICPKMPICYGCDKVFGENESREDHLLVCTNQRIQIGEKSPAKVEAKNVTVINCPKCGQVKPHPHMYIRAGWGPF